jgi:hypothetical protein
VNGEADGFLFTVLYGEHKGRRTRPVPEAAGTSDDDLRELTAREVDQRGCLAAVYLVALRYLNLGVDRSGHRCLLRIGEAQYRRGGPLVRASPARHEGGTQKSEDGGEGDPE